MTASPSDSLAEDLLVGAGQIALHLYGSDEARYRKRVYHLCTGAKLRLPHFRLGFQLAARKSVLRDWIEAQETSRD